MRAYQRIQARQARQRIQARQARRQVTTGGRKKRRRKKRTKKKTRRKRRKSRKRKTKRRRKKKTRKRKAGCWPFCKPNVLKQPLIPQQQEAPTMTPQEIEDYNIDRLIQTSSGNRSRHTERRNRRLAANEAAAKEAANTQGGD
jgi:hypothetical protein